MRRILTFRNTGVLAILLLFAIDAFAQTLNKGEYFFDIEPGTGNGIPLSFTPGNTINTDVAISTSSLSPGFHTVNIRLHDNSGYWSHFTSRSFYIAPSSIITPPATNVARAEYFFDTDPGPGHGVSIALSAGVTIDQNLVVPTGSLTGGFHNLNFRTFDDQKKWSHNATRSFYIIPTGTAIQATNISHAEYFFDADPGTGLGTSIPITASASINQNITVPVSSLTSGFHNLYVRTKANNGGWSHFASRSFYIVPSLSSVASTVINKAEYFFDADPGTGHGTSLPMTSANTLDNNFAIDISSLQPGFHLLAVRFKDDRNQWSHYPVRSFYIVKTSAANTLNIKKLEYFVDADPGFGVASNLSISPSASIDQQFAIDLSGTTAGTHVLHVRAKDTNGFWSEIQSGNFTLLACTSPTAPISNNVSRCDAGAVTLTASGASGVQVYRWYADASTQTALFTGASFITPVLSANTNYFVSIYDPSTLCESNRTQVTAIVTIIPKPTLNLTGSLTVCAGNSVTLVAPPGFVSYLWSNGLTTQQITVSTSGNYSVVVGDGTCASPSSDPFSFTVNPNPVKPIITATGGGSLCGTGSVTLSAPAGLTTYSWSSGQSTQNIVVNAIGNFTVTVTDANGCQSVSSDVFTVTSSALTKPVITVTGNSTICGSGSVQLTAPAGFSSYAWSNGDVSQTSTVNSSGSYTVTVTNGTCTSPVSDAVSITVVAVLAKPTITVTGTTALCNSSFTVLSAPAGFSNYLWSDGETARQIVVSAPGSFSVQVGNDAACLSIASDPTMITLTGLPCGGGGIPAAPNTTSSSRCGTGTVSLSASGAVNSQVYRWYDLPSSGSLLFTGTTFSTPSISSTTPYYVSIYDPTSTGESSRTSVTATVVNIAAPVIAGPGSVSVCAGSSTLLSAPTGFVSYLWSNGASTQQIQISTGGNYSVQVGDGTCVSPASNSITVSIVPAIAKPTIAVTGNTTLCGSSSVQLSAPTGFSYLWSTGAISQNITVGTSGNYSVTISNGTCTSSSSDPINVTSVSIPAKPAIQITGSTTLCNSAFVALDAPAGFSSYLWSNGETVSRIVVSTAGIYTVQVGNAANCLSLVSDAVTITTSSQPCNSAVLPPLPPTASNATRCGNGTVTLTGSGASGTQVYRWYDASLSGILLFTGPTFTTPSLSANTSYYVSIYDPSTFGESNRVIANATIVNLVKPSITPNTTLAICAGTSTLLTAPIGFTQYIWSNGAVTQQLPVTVAGSYSVKVGDGTCLSTASDPVAVGVAAIPSKPVIIITGNTTFCIEGSVDLSGPDGYNYLWSNGSTTQKITITESAVISLVIKNNTGCSSVASDPVVITKQVAPCKPNTAPVIAQKPIAVKIEGIATADLTEFITDAENNIDYTSIHLLTATTTQGAKAYIDASYILTIDYKGILFSGTDHITLEVSDLLGLRAQSILEIDVVGEVVVFNGISPDGDGKNDFLRLQYVDIIPGAQKNKVTIFNRWGDEVFGISDYNNVDRIFNGTGNGGNELPSGSYFYRIDLSDGKPITGYITLKR